MAIVDIVDYYLQRATLKYYAQPDQAGLAADLAARRSAAQHGALLNGSVGILAACLQRGLLTYEEANHLLARMIAAGYRSPITQLD